MLFSITLLFLLDKRSWKIGLKNYSSSSKNQTRQTQEVSSVDFDENWCLWALDLSSTPLKFLQVGLSNKMGYISGMAVETNKNILFFANFTEIKLLTRNLKLWWALTPSILAIGNRCTWIFLSVLTQGYKWHISLLFLNFWIAEAREIPPFVEIQGFAISVKFESVFRGSTNTFQSKWIHVPFVNNKSSYM